MAQGSGEGHGGLTKNKLAACSKHIKTKFLKATTTFTSCAMCGGLRSVVLLSLFLLLLHELLPKLKRGAVARRGRGSILALCLSPCRSCHFYSQKPSCLGQQQSPFAATCCNCCRIKCAARLRRISLLLWATRFYNPPTALHHSPAPPSPLFPTLVDCTPPAEISLHFMLSDFRERRSRCSRLL